MRWLPNILATPSTRVRWETIQPWFLVWSMCVYVLLNITCFYHNQLLDFIPTDLRRLLFESRWLANGNASHAVQPKRILVFIWLFRKGQFDRSRWDFAPRYAYDFGVIFFFTHLNDWIWKVWCTLMKSCTCLLCQYLTMTPKRNWVEEWLKFGRLSPNTGKLKTKLVIMRCLCLISNFHLIETQHHRE